MSELKIPKISTLVILDAETIEKAEVLATEQAEGNRSRLIRALIRAEWLRTHSGVYEAKEG